MGDPKGGTASGTAYDINVDLYGKRLKLFFKCWADHKEDLWGSADVVVVLTPPTSQVLRYLKSSALNVWLLEYEFSETLMVFMAGAVHVLCGQKKASILEPIKRASKSRFGIDLVLHIKPKNDDGSTYMQDILEAAKSHSRNPTVGVLSKETAEGRLMQKWAEVLENSGLQQVDVAAGFSELFGVKDESEISCIKKAAFIGATVLKSHVVPKLERIIDDEKKVTHAELMDDAEAVIAEPSKLVKKFRTEGSDICYPPIFQSGGVYDLKPSATSNDDPLYYDAMAVIVCALGARFNMYCSNVARTYLIDAEKFQEKVYKILLKAQEAAISALKAGNPMSAPYKAACSIVEQEASELLPNLTKNVGTGIGLEFRESAFSLNAKNDKILKPGMAFNVNLGFQNLQAETSSSSKTKNFSVLIADTVLVGEKGPENLTAICSKAFTDIAYSFETEEKAKPKADTNGSEFAYVKTALRSDNQEMTKEEERRRHQAELARKKNDETARRLAAGGAGNGEGQSSVKSSGEISAYRSVDDMPPSRDLQIQIDQKHEAVLLPVYGVMVPFHIATVKTITSQQDGGISYIRIIFNVPGAGLSPNDVPMQKFSHMIYLKEISFRSTDTRHSTHVVQQMKTLKKQVNQRESEKAERATLVSQEKLVLSKAKPIKLTDLWIRPPFGGRGRKMPGTLEAHVNGFRYSTMKADEKVDVMYRNIKHAFFQPSEKEMITLVHFHLHNHIMVGNKKTKDVQFFVEVMEVVQSLGMNRRYGGDPDEIEEEQAERDRKNKINSDFTNFVKRVADMWEQPPLKSLELEFDIPFRGLGFHGVPNKSSAFIVPTLNCLVELIEFPFLVVTLNDIEIVNLERVGFAQKAFDLAIVFKDFKRDVLRIDAIPSSSLDGIKEWLNSMSIKYYESRMNLNWKTVLKAILDNPSKFIDNGGWEFLNMDASDSDSEKSEESDQGYEPSDLEQPSESEDEDSDDESVVESEEEEEEEEDSEEEEGLSWDELEAKAKREDKEQGGESDSEDERRRRKAKVSAAGKAKSRIPDSRDRVAPPSKRPKFR